MGRKGPVPKVMTRNRYPGRIPLPPDPPADQAAPDPPDDLDAEARAEWGRVVAELATLGILAKTDRAALHAYAVCWARWRRAEAVVRDQGPTYQQASGLIRARPEVRVAEVALAQLRLFLASFGLTPEARERMRLEVDSGKPDPLTPFREALA